MRKGAHLSNQLDIIFIKKLDIKARLYRPFGIRPHAIRFTMEGSELGRGC